VIGCHGNISLPSRICLSFYLILNVLSYFSHILSAVAFLFRGYLFLQLLYYIDYRALLSAERGTKVSLASWVDVCCVVH
jgi:sensor histidine kinase YesM